MLDVRTDGLSGASPLRLPRVRRWTQDPGVETSVVGPQINVVRHSRHVRSPATSAISKNSSSSRGCRVRRSKCHTTTASRTPAFVSTSSSSYAGRGLPDHAPLSLSSYTRAACQPRLSHKARQSFPAVEARQLVVQWDRQRCGRRSSFPPGPGPFSGIRYQDVIRLGTRISPFGAPPPWRSPDRSRSVCTQPAHVVRSSRRTHGRVDSVKTTSVVSVS